MRQANGVSGCTCAVACDVGLSGTRGDRTHPKRGRGGAGASAVPPSAAAGAAGAAAAAPRPPLGPLQAGWSGVAGVERGGGWSVDRRGRRRRRRRRRSRESTTRTSLSAQCTVKLSKQASKNGNFRPGRKTGPLQEIHGAKFGRESNLAREAVPLARQEPSHPPVQPPHWRGLPSRSSSWNGAEIGMERPRFRSSAFPPGPPCTGGTKAAGGAWCAPGGAGGRRGAVWARRAAPRRPPRG